MPVIDESVLIPVPSEKVWDHVFDPVRLPAYDPSILTSEFDDGWPAIGSRFKAKRKVLGRVFDETAEVTECGRPRRLGFKSVEGNLDFTGGYTLTPEGEGTLLEFRLDVRSDLGGVVGRVADSATNLVARRQVRGILAAVARDLTERPDLYYEERGEGVPILLIPQAGATASTWGTMIDDLANFGRVIAYDRRGYARSGGEPLRSIAEHTADATALLDRLGVSPVVAVGTSVGATIAIDLARLRPDLVRAVVAHESPWHVTRRPPTASEAIALSKGDGSPLGIGTRKRCQPCWSSPIATGTAGRRGSGFPASGDRQHLKTPGPRSPISASRWAAIRPPRSWPGSEHQSSAAPAAAAHRKWWP